MTKVVLKIDDRDDLEMILALVKRLGIGYDVVKSDQPSLTEEERAEYQKILNEGAPLEDFPQRLRDFEEGKEDRKLLIIE